MVPALAFALVLIAYCVVSSCLRRAARQEVRREAAVCRWERLVFRSVIRAKWRRRFTDSGIILRHLKSQERSFD